VADSASEKICGANIDPVQIANTFPGVHFQAFNLRTTEVSHEGEQVAFAITILVIRCDGQFV